MPCTCKGTPRNQCGCARRQDVAKRYGSGPRTGRPVAGRADHQGRTPQIIQLTSETGDSRIRPLLGLVPLGSSQRDASVEKVEEQDRDLDLASTEVDAPPSRGPIYPPLHKFRRPLTPLAASRCNVSFAYRSVDFLRRSQESFLADTLWGSGPRSGGDHLCVDFGIDAAHGTPIYLEIPRFIVTEAERLPSFVPWGDFDELAQQFAPDLARSISAVPPAAADNAIRAHRRRGEPGLFFRRDVPTSVLRLFWRMFIGNLPLLDIPVLRDNAGCSLAPRDWLAVAAPPALSAGPNLWSEFPGYDSSATPTKDRFTYVEVQSNAIVDGEYADRGGDPECPVTEVAVQVLGRDWRLFQGRSGLNGIATPPPRSNSFATGAFRSRIAANESGVKGASYEGKRISFCPGSRLARPSFGADYSFWIASLCLAWARSGVPDSEKERILRVGSHAFQYGLQMVLSGCSDLVHEYAHSSALCGLGHCYQSGLSFDLYECGHDLPKRLFGAAFGVRYRTGRPWEGHWFSNGGGQVDVAAGPFADSSWLLREPTVGKGCGCTGGTVGGERGTVSPLHPVRLGMRDSISRPIIDATPCGGWSEMRVGGWYSRRREAVFWDISPFCMSEGIDNPRRVGHVVFDQLGRVMEK